LDKESDDKIRSVTLRVAIFFGLTTFTLCIAIFYIESILGETQDLVTQKDSTIESMRQDMDAQMERIIINENEISVLQNMLKEKEKAGQDEE